MIQPSPAVHWTKMEKASLCYQQPYVPDKEVAERWAKYFIAPYQDGWVVSTVRKEWEINGAHLIIPHSGERVLYDFEDCARTLTCHIDINDLERIEQKMVDKALFADLCRIEELNDRVQQILRLKWEWRFLLVARLLIKAKAEIFQINWRLSRLRKPANLSPGLFVMRIMRKIEVFRIGRRLKKAKKRPRDC